jgi:Subtilase family
MPEDSESPAWSERVAFSAEGIAYQPHEVLVRRAGADVADGLLDEDLDREESGNFVRYRGSAERPIRVRGRISDPLRAVRELQLEGVFAQPNHVLFAHCECCCPVHPAALFANPFHANPFHANPFHANPFHANPFHANPFHANPFHANFAPSPTVLIGSGAPEAATFAATGVRHTSAVPAAPPPRPPNTALLATAADGPSIVVVDTGLAVANLRPQALSGLTGDDEEPDENDDTFLDSVAGHGTFIAGIIHGIAPRCRLHVNGLLTGEGDVTEDAVAVTLENLASASEGAPDLVNLSFGGYTVVGMERLRDAIQTLQDAGTVVVASAGNDATCAPAYPAAFPDVVSVGAIGPDGPAFFSNYGAWVRACAPGIDIVSTFFTQTGTTDAVDYHNWVQWSGTSFSAPIVVAALAEQMRMGGLTASEAVKCLIDAPGLLRIENLGTVINRQPWV